MNLGSVTLVFSEHGRFQGEVKTNQRTISDRYFRLRSREGKIGPACIFHFCPPNITIHINLTTSSYVRRV